MKAKEANKTAKERRNFGLLIDAIEKEAKKGHFELDVRSIDIGESQYELDKHERKWLEDNGYIIYTIYSECDWDGDKDIITWND